MEKIIIKNNKECQLQTENEEVVKKVKKLLSFKASGVEYTQAYKNGWNGITYLLSNKGTFGLGLLNHVINNLPEFEFEIVDNRKNTFEYVPMDLSKKLESINMIPREHQVRCLDAAKNNNKGILRSATGSGKCNNIDSVNLTELGMLSYRELSEYFNISLNDGEAYPIKIDVATPLNKDRDEASMIYHDGKTMSKKITTRFGYSVTGTLDHKIKVIDKSGDFLWKRMEDLSFDDYAVISYNNQMFGKEKMSNDEAYFLGLIIGDGSIADSHKNSITITNMDQHIIDFVMKYTKSIGLNPKLSQTKSKAHNIHVHSSKYRKHLLNLGFKYCKSTGKEIPKYIRMLEKEPLSYLIRGIYETDGWVEKTNDSTCICLALSNEKIIEQIQLILLNFGIVSSKSVKKTKNENSHKITIYSSFVDRFMEQIGLDKLGHKYNKVMSSVKKVKNDNVDLIPNQEDKINNIYKIITKEKINLTVKKHTIRSWASWRTPSRSNLKSMIYEFENKYKETYDSLKIKEILDGDLIYLKIEKIENVMSDNYDFSIPKTHSFVSQGFINHNTMIAAMIAAEFNEPTIIYVIGLDLLQQFHNLFSKIFDEEIGWIGNGIVNPKRITIASIWSLGSALDFKKTLFLDDEATKELPASLQDKKKILECLKAAKTHIIDECHACTCDTIQSIYKFIDPKRIYGLSGTPYRDDGSDLLVTSLLGEIIEDVSASELIEKKILTEPIIKFVMVPHQNIQVRTYNEVYKEYVVCNEYRNNMILSQSIKLIEKGYKVLVLFKTIDHGKMLLEMFRDKNVNCDLLNGNDSLDKRNEVKAKLEAGNLDCLIASTILDIGFDAPILSALVLAGAGKSKIRALQRIGRIIRFHPSKKRCAVVDFMDNCRFLDKHSKIRYETYKQESGFKILGS